MFSVGRLFFSFRILLTKYRCLNETIERALDNLIKYFTWRFHVPKGLISKWINCKLHLGRLKSTSRTWEFSQHVNTAVFKSVSDCRKQSRDCFGLVCLLIGSKKWWVISLPIRNQQSIGVGLTSRSSWLCVTPSRFQSRRPNWFSFCSSLICKNEQLIPWIPSAHGWLKW